jgi:hypothetical protein
MENEGDVPEAEATAARAARATVTRIVAVGMWKKERQVAVLAIPSSACEIGRKHSFQCSPVREYKLFAASPNPGNPRARANPGNPFEAGQIAGCRVSTSARAATVTRGGTGSASGAAVWTRFSKPARHVPGCVPVERCVPRTCDPGAADWWARSGMRPCFSGVVHCRLFRCSNFEIARAGLVDFTNPTVVGPALVATTPAAAAAADICLACGCCNASCGWLRRVALRAACQASPRWLHVSRRRAPVRQATYSRAPCGRRHDAARPPWSAGRLLTTYFPLSCGALRH